MYDVAQVGLAVPKPGRGSDTHALHAHSHDFAGGGGGEGGKTTIATVAWDGVISRFGRISAYCYNFTV